MKIIKYGQGIKTLRWACTKCGTLVELEPGDLRATRATQLDPEEASYDCPACGELQAFDKHKLPPALFAPVKR